METAKLDAQISHYFQMNRYAQVRELIQRGLVDDPERAWYFYLLGLCDYFEDHHDSAIQHLNRSMELGMEEEQVYLYLGYVYMDSKRLVESERAFLDCLRENPNNASAHAAYAYLMAQTGFFEKSERLMMEAMRIDPLHESVLRYKHLLAVASGEKKEQADSMRKLVEVSSSTENLYAQMAVEALHRERIREAYKLYKQAYLQDPTNQNYLEILKQLEPEAHILKAPLFFMDKYGGLFLWYYLVLGALVGLSTLLGEAFDPYFGLIAGLFILYRFGIGLIVKFWLWIRG